MRRMLLTTTAVLTFMMFSPQAEAHSTSACEHPLTLSGKLEGISNIASITEELNPETRLHISTPLSLASPKSIVFRYRENGADLGARRGAPGDCLPVAKASDVHPLNVAINQSSVPVLVQQNDAADDSEDIEDDEDEDEDEEEEEEEEDDSDEGDDPDEDDGPDDNDDDDGSVKSAPPAAGSDGKRVPNSGTGTRPGTPPLGRNDALPGKQDRNIIDDATAGSAGGTGAMPDDTADDEEGPDATPDDDEGDVTADEDNEDLGGDANDRNDDGEDEEDDGPSSVPGQLSVTINGRATLQAGVGGDLTRRLQFRNKTEIEFNVGGKADNGLLYGMKLQLENTTGGNSTSESTVDEAYVYLGGRWGRLEFGDTDDVVAGGLLVYAPSVGIGQIDGDYGNFSKLSLDDYYPFYPDLETSTKVNYYSPRIAGFQFGVSYTPYYGDKGQSVVGFKPRAVRRTSASSLTSSVSGSSVSGSVSTGAVLQAAIPPSSLLSAPTAPEGSAVSSSSSSFKNVSAAIPATPPRPPVVATTAVAPPVALTSQVIEDDDDEEEENDDEEEDDEEGDDDEEDDDEEDDDDGTDEEPDVEEPGPVQPVPVPVPPTPEQPVPVPPTPEQPVPVPPTPEQPAPGQPSPEQPAPQPPPVQEPQPETPIVEVPEEEVSGYRDITTLAVNYQRDLGDVTVTGSAAVMNGSGYGEGFKDFTAWLGGVQVGFADFTFGGGFGKFDGFNSIDWEWNIGATYETGPFSVGAQYAWVQDVNGDKSWATGVGVNYVLAPGLSLQADYVHSRVDFDRSRSVNTVDVVILGLQLSF